MADTKPIMYEEERTQLRQMFEKLNIGIGEISISGDENAHNPSTHS